MARFFLAHEIDDSSSINSYDDLKYLIRYDNLHKNAQIHNASFLKNGEEVLKVHLHHEITDDIEHWGKHGENQQIISFCIDEDGIHKTFGYEIQDFYDKDIGVLVFYKYDYPYECINS